MTENNQQPSKIIQFSFDNNGDLFVLYADGRLWKRVYNLGWAMGIYSWELVAGGEKEI